MKATLIGLVLLGATVVAAPTWRVEKGDVRVICSMTIGGSFDAKTACPQRGGDGPRERFGAIRREPRR